MQYLSDHSVDDVYCFSDLRCEQCAITDFNHGVRKTVPKVAQICFKFN